MRLEEAVSGRLKELASDRRLLVQLARDALKNSGGRKEELDRLIASTEQEKRNVQRQIDNLLGVLAEGEGASLRVVLEKVAEKEAQRDKLVETMNSLREERAHSGSVIDIEQAFRLFRYSREDFDGLQVSRQRELLREVVSKITVTEDGIRVVYFGAPKEETLNLNPAGESPAGSDFTFAASEKPSKIMIMTRTPVRAASNLVETVGVEPTSESNPSPESTCVGVV